MVRAALLALSAVLLTIGLAPAAPALAQASCGASGAVTTLNGSLPDGATYLLQCPAGAWNGTLGPAYNIFAVGKTVSPTAPAFIPYRPAPYLRPFDLPSR